MLISSSENQGFYFLFYLGIRYVYVNNNNMVYKKKSTVNF